MSNLYMRRFVEGWRRLGCERRWSAHIVNYADDFVICCKRGAPEAMAAKRRIMERLPVAQPEPGRPVAQRRLVAADRVVGLALGERRAHRVLGQRGELSRVERGDVRRRRYDRDQVDAAPARPTWALHTA